jgi:hypothetical protein
MTRLVTHALALAPTLVAGAAAAHPGHGTPHVLHEGDAALGWWIFAAVAVGALATWIAAKHRS